MIILSYGMMKSGSTLAFELCKSILTQSGYEQRRLPDGVVTPGHHINFLDRFSVDALEQILEEVSSSERIAIKTHASIRPAELEFVERAIADGRVKLQVNVRDPREMCLSLADAGASAREKKRRAFSEIINLETAATVAERQLNICRNWGSIRGATFLHYNEVAFDTPVAVRRICEDFGCKLFDNDELSAVIDRVFHEAFTQRNKAVKDRYKDDLTVRQNEYLLEAVKGARAFIRRVCEQHDYSWFAKPGQSQPGAIGQGVPVHPV